MARRLRQRRLSLAFAGVAIYVVSLVAAGFDHHDLLCHLKTPSHCTACASSPLSAEPHIRGHLQAPSLADAGHVVPLLPSVRALLLSVRSTGRSPPADI